MTRRHRAGRTQSGERVVMLMASSVLNLHILISLEAVVVQEVRV